MPVGGLLLSYKYLNFRGATWTTWSLNLGHAGLKFLLPFSPGVFLSVTWRLCKMSPYLQLLLSQNETLGLNIALDS